MNRFTFIPLLLLGIFLNLTTTAQIIYVTPAGAGNFSGSNWSNGLKAVDLQPALRGATAGTSFLIAAGTYKPTTTTSRDSAFVIARPGIKLYGGYNAATGVRDIAANPTILSGDIGLANDTSDNSYHVMVIAGIIAAADSIVVDGITIEKGTASQSATAFNYNGQNIWRYEGGGMMQWGNSGGTKIQVRNCTFNSNAATDGGGFANILSPLAKSLVDNCIFTGNTARQLGAGMFNYSTYDSLNGCTFLGNISVNNGGGIYSNNSPVILRQCVFSANIAVNGIGGGVYNTGSLENIVQCRFTGNSAGYDGGGIHSSGVNSGKIWSCIFNNNTANWGAGMCAFTSSVICANSVFAGNSVTSSGSGIYYSGGTPSCISCTFLGNGNSYSMVADGCAAIVSNTVFGDIPNAVRPVNGGTINMTYSLIRGGYPGLGNINTTPLFFDAADPDGADDIFGTADDGLQLLKGSPAINAARNDSLPVGIITDITGAARIQNTIIDMGAYEGGICLPSNTLYVDSSVATSGRGNSWASPFKEFRDALSVAQQCTGITSILVAKGTYKPVNTLNRDSSFIISRSNLKIYGGYKASNGTRNIKANPTILSGDIDNNGDNNNNTYHILLVNGINVSDSLVLDGLTITGGRGDNGGIKNYDGIPIRNDNGGGVNIFNNIFSAPIAFRNCTINNNYSDNGGGLYTRNCSISFNNCFITGNTASTGGGITMSHLTSSTITSCVVAGNVALNTGGAVYGDFTSLDINSSSFQGNTAPNSGAVSSGSGFNASITNAVFWGNSSFTGGVNLTVTYSDIQGGYPGTGNIDTDPIFINAADLDGPDNIFGTADDGLLLQAGSIAIDAGANATVPAWLITDITGAARIQDNIVNIGAYEGIACPTFNTIYVDSSVVTTGKGDSWSSAFKDFRNALRAAQLCSGITTINVATGTYKPSPGPDRDSSFSILRRNLKVYGGFPAGGGTRDFRLNPTILSADIGLQGYNGDNSYHVMVIAGLPSGVDSVVVDGFTITQGVANGSGTKIYNGTTVGQIAGAGLYLLNNNSLANKLAIRNCTFLANAATTWGGGIYNEVSSPEISGCIFLDNTAQNAAGIFSYIFSSPRITNCVFKGNDAEVNGGAIYNESSFGVSITNCTITGNNCPGYGGGIYNSSAGLVLRNCIVWGNSGVVPGLYNYNVAPNLAYNIIQGGANAPMFVDITDADGPDNLLGTADDGLRLLPGGAGTNLGYNLAVPSNISLDITGNARIQNTVVDMGAYEGSSCPAYNVLYVDSSIAVTGRGNSWSSPFKDLREALALARQCSGVTDILVAKGTYTPTADLRRDSSFMISRGGLKIYGGYPSGGGSRNVLANQTVLSGDIGNLNDSTDNSYHVVLIPTLPAGADSLILDGFTIKQGNANVNVAVLLAGQIVVQTYGGGIYAGRNVTGKTAFRNCVITNNTAGNGGGLRNNSGASPTLINCTFNANNAPAGGGISNDSCFSVINNCKFKANNAITYGAGILNWNGSVPVISNCSFSANTGGSGTGIYNSTSAAVVTGCSFIGNKSTASGGGICNSSSAAVLTGCSFESNTAFSGGGIYNINNSPKINSCTFQFNIAAGRGGGMYNNNTSALLDSCKFLSNTAYDGGAGMYNQGAFAPELNHCTFNSNNGTTYGGAIENLGASPLVKNSGFTLNSSKYGGAVYNQTCAAMYTSCSFFSNSAMNGGGMENLASASPVITNCIFSLNTASNYGGGIFSGGSAPVVLNSTFNGNNSVSGGGGLANLTATSLISNCIIWGNTGATPGIYNSGGAPKVNYSLVEGAGIFPGTGNLNADPLFINSADADGADNILGTPDDGLNIQQASPAINGGINDSLPAGLITDFTAGGRYYNCVVDMGAYESKDPGNAYWNGNVNTDWNNPGNWCEGVIPDATKNVIIGRGPNYPVITGITATANNIAITSLAEITTNPSGTLSFRGFLKNAGSLTNNGSIVLNGTLQQSFPGTTGTIPAMNNIEVNNPGGAVIDRSFTLTGTLRPTAGIINLNDVTVTLHSDASGTASVGTLGSAAGFTYSGSGKFSVERYISSATKTGWRFISAPIAGPQTINQAWQEGELPAVYTPTGYGMQITGPASAGSGFDVSTASPSLKTWDAATNLWVSVPGTGGAVSNVNGYMAFVRGDRGAHVFGATSATTLREGGPIKTGNVGPVSTTTANSFISVANPYPSAINFTTAAKSGLKDVYYLWDPKLGTYGGYQTFTGPAYTATPGGGSYAGGNKVIESGMAFFVSASSAMGTHSISFSENNKVNGSNQVAKLVGEGRQLRTQLSSLAASDVNLIDGTLIEFDAANSNMVDDMDAIKLSNFGENIGISAGSKTLSVERHAEIISSDTIFYQLGQMKQQQYELKFIPNDLAAPGLTAFFEDSYLQTSVPVELNDSSKINFTVDGNAGSSASNRFRIVFKQSGPLPVTFTTVEAYKQDQNIMVEWKVENELNIDHYEIERSADGHAFSSMAAQAAISSGSTNSYEWLDQKPLKADNFYRIKSIGAGSDIKYSQVVKVKMEKNQSPAFTIYPNPVVSAEIGLTLNNQEKGVYQIRLYNSIGQLILSQAINHPGGSQRNILKTPASLPRGIYNLTISGENMAEAVLRIIAQ